MNTITCPRCHGSGEEPGAASSTDETALCSKCHGKGSVPVKAKGEAAALRKADKPVDGSLATAFELLQIAPCDFERTMETLDPEQAHGTDWPGIQVTLDAIAEKAAVLSAYIEAVKGLAGCGPRSHGEACKAAAKRSTRVRRALGCTYPERGIRIR